MREELLRIADSLDDAASNCYYPRTITDLAEELRALAEKAGAEPAAWMRRTVTYREGDGRMEGERIVSESKVYDDDVPLYTAPPSQPATLPDVQKVSAEMLAVAPMCENDWDAQLREWAAMLAAAPEVPK